MCRLIPVILVVISFITLSCNSESKEGGGALFLKEDTLSVNESKEILFSDAPIDCNINIVNDTILFKTLLLELDSVLVYSCSFVDSLNVGQKGFVTYSKTDAKCIDLIVDTVFIGPPKTMELIGDWVHFTSEYPFTFGYFKYLRSRQGVDRKPLVCDTTGLITESNFYYIDSAGSINSFDEYRVRFKEECKKYSRKSY